jgi:hypothetical protein
MQRSFAVGAVIVSGVLLASTVAAAATPTGLNTPRPGGKEMHVQGGTNISGWAVVNADGSLARKLNVKSAARLGAGTYEVIFNSALNNCNYQATPATAGISGAPTGFIGLSPRSGNDRGVFILTRDITGVTADLAFHLQVTCN